jgi:hypothetical protein
MNRHFGTLQLIAERILERRVSVLLTDKQVDRLRVSQLNKRIRAHERSLERCRRHRYY